MSFPVNSQTLPTSVLQGASTPETVGGRTSVKSPISLSFPKSRSALWDGSPAGDKVHLHLCSYRKPRLVLLEKALRLAQRHVHHSNTALLQGFFLGSVSVDSDEEGVTVTLDRFDPGRKQTSGRVPSALLPGDVLVPCLFTTKTEGMSDDVVQSEAELHHCFRALKQFLGSRQTLDLSQLLKVKGRVVCSRMSDAAAFCLSWSAVCPSITLEIQPVRAIPIIPMALLRSLTSINRPLQLLSSQQRGFLTMDQTRKLLLLLESDPKASTLPLVGLWLSGVTHIYNPEVWAWCLRFLFSSSLQDRVLSESGCFLLVVFGLTHRAPQFFQCRVPRLRPGPAPAIQLGYQLLTAVQSVTLYQVASVDNQTLQCELSSDDHLSTQLEVFTKAQSSYVSTLTPSAALPVSDQDSGVEDEDLSPRPSPSPHAPAQQTRRVQPSVPELSLLIDTSFTSNQPTSTHITPPPAASDRKSAPATGNTFTTPPSFLAPTPHPAPHHLHSTPTSNVQQPCTCCSTQAYNCTSICSSAVQIAAPAPPPSSLHPAAPPPSSLHPAAPLPSSLQSSSLHHQTSPSTQNHPTFSAPPSSTHGTTMFFQQPAATQTTHQSTFPLFHNPSSPFSTHQKNAVPSTPLPPPVLWGGDFPSPHSFNQADPASPLQPCRNQCYNQTVGAVPPDTYQLLLQQDQQLRLLQAQVQMLLEAQRKLQSCSQHDTHTRRSAVSIAVGTGASLFWGNSQQPLPEDLDAPPPSFPPTPPLPSSPDHSSSSRDLSVERLVGEAKDDDVPGQMAPCSPSRRHSFSSVQSPILGESKYKPVDNQQSFYHNLMTQLTSRLQNDSKQEMEQDEPKRRSLLMVSDRSWSSQPSQESSSRRKQQSPVGDPVVSATLRQLQQLGVNVDEEVLTESDRNRVRTLDSASTLAGINPAAVVSRLGVSDLTVGSLLPGGSVDLSLEANAIALRYLSDSQLSRLSLEGPTQRPAPASSCDSLLSPSNMSLATRKYMMRYGLIEEEDGEEEEQEEVRVQDTSSRRPLTEALNLNLLPQSQLIRDLRPKMQLLVGDANMNTASDKENCSGSQKTLKASSRQTEGSVGNILDLSRLRQLPKLF